jgi:hypothetical protein
MYDLSAALISLKPGAAWSLNGDDYEGLNWLDQEQTKPTKEECIAEMARLKSAYEAKEYQRKRVVEYPSIGDQLDALFHAGVFPEDMAEQIQAIKDKYPKV